MPWIILIIAGLLEIVWAAAMKQSHGLPRPLPTAIMLAGMVGSFWLLAVAMRQLPLGTAYMVWTGIGAIGSFLLGIALFGEAVSAGRLAAVALIGTGILVMKLSS